MTTPVHLVKLCVGISEPAELIAWHGERLAEMKKAGEPLEFGHTTRNMPRRRDEVLAGGSLYWVIAGYIQLRQPIADLREVRGRDGTLRCRIVLATSHIATVPAPRRPFQGWRYLEASDVPRDIEGGAGEGLPQELHRELAELGLL